MSQVWYVFSTLFYQNTAHFCKHSFAAINLPPPPPPSVKGKCSSWLYPLLYGHVTWHTLSSFVCISLNVNVLLSSSFVLYTPWGEAPILCILWRQLTWKSCSHPSSASRWTSGLASCFHDFTQLLLIFALLRAARLCMYSVFLFMLFPLPGVSHVTTHFFPQPLFPFLKSFFSLKTFCLSILL